MVLSIVTTTVSSWSVDDLDFGKLPTVATISQADFDSFISHFNSARDRYTTDVVADSGTNSIDMTTEVATDIYTVNPFDVNSDLPIDSNDSTELRCLTHTQLEMAMDAVVKVLATEIQSDKTNSSWEYLEKLNFDNEQLITKIVKLTMDVEYMKKCNALNNLLRFINYTSNVDLRLFAYDVVVHTISSDSTLCNQTTNWLSLQHFVSHDNVIGSNSKFQSLLNEIESKTNDVLDSPHFDHLRVDKYCSPIYDTFTFYVEYLIKRFCSTDPANIKVLWKAIVGKSLPMEAVMQFVKELERNDRLNYTTMVIPYLRERWYTISANPDTCRKLLEIFPENSISRHLLSSSDNQFFIKNAYSGEYMCYEKTVDWTPSYSSIYYYSERPTKPTNIFLCSSENSTWRFHGQNQYSIGSGELYSRNTILDKCPRHNEWYFALSQEYVSKYYNFPEYVWELETDNILNKQYRFKSLTSGGYLRVGPNNDLLISIPECSKTDDQRSEWILELSSHSNAEIKCKSSDEEDEDYALDEY